MALRLTLPTVDCFPNILSSPNVTFIAQCQAAGTTPFCWPPNGSRICAPSKDIPFFWPKSYYHPSSRVAIEYDLSSRLLLLLNNTGNRTEDFTQYMYTAKAYPIPDSPNERSMKMYMRERRIGDDVEDKTNLAVHEGPTLILVKTASFTETVKSARATSTSRPYYSSDDDDDDDDDDDGRPHLGSGALAGIILASIFAFVVLLVCCCKGCCGCGKQPGPARPKMTKEEQDRIMREGTELMEQRKAVGASEAEEGRGGGPEGPPPKYTP